ncbi:MAG: M81 family metallopeptidase [Acidimicrobiaceae bacterium]|nr:M81 family metallopeptidase [Acidimicrobiaceae bacterium]
MSSWAISKDSDRATRFERNQKIGVLSVIQESNSFSPQKTSIGNFTIATASELLIRIPNANLEFEGSLDEITRCGGEGIAIFNAFALPSGPIELSSLSQLIGLVREHLNPQTSLDGLVLCLHGAMLDEQGHSADLAILRMAREYLENSIPMAVSLDLHANISSEFLDLATIISGYKTNPHVDLNETGRRVVQLLAQVLSGQLKPVMHLEKCPTIFADETLNTSTGVFADILKDCTANLHPSIVDVSIFPCQPWIDSPGVGFGSLCLANGDSQPAIDLTTNMVQEVWRQKKKFKITNLATPEEAIQIAKKSNIRPFIIAEASDAPTAGAAGDSPVMIAAILDSDSDLVTYIPITDAIAVNKCYESQVGAEISLSLGCTIDNRWTKPVLLTATINNFGEGNYNLSGSGYYGMKVSMGRFAVVTCNSMKILITALPCWSADPATWSHAQLNPADAQLIVVRSCSDFRANFPEASATAITLDVLGSTSIKFTELPYKNCRIGTWPIDPTIN